MPLFYTWGLFDGYEYKDKINDLNQELKETKTLREDSKKLKKELEEFQNNYMNQIKNFMEQFKEKEEIKLTKNKRPATKEPQQKN